MRMLMLSVVAAVAGCAYVPPAADYSAMAQAYHAVRTGTQPRADAERIRFCAAGDEVEAARTWGESADNWIDKVPDDHIVEDVHGVLSHDAALHGQDIRARVDQGEVILSGNVPSDAIAMRAARDVIDVRGVVAVNIQIASPESPRPPVVGQAVPAASCFGR